MQAVLASGIRVPAMVRKGRTSPSTHAAHDCSALQTGVPGPWLPLANTYAALWEGSNLPAPPYDLQIASPNATVDAP